MLRKKNFLHNLLTFDIIIFIIFFSNHIYLNKALTYFLSYEDLYILAYEKFPSEFKYFIKKTIAQYPQNWSCFYTLFLLIFNLYKVGVSKIFIIFLAYYS
jgi:hypothetical protein